MKQIGSAFLFILLLVPAAWAQQKELPPAQADLVETERAFAKLGFERGVRESFIAYFADDGIGFNPHPFKVKETLSRQPAPTTRPQFSLNWAPAFGDISMAGDLGYNTGPTVIEDTGPEKRPTRHGMFFSVWKKQADGNWRVMLDLGADTPSAVVPLDAPFKTSHKSTPSSAKKSVNINAEIEGLLNVERKFLAAAKSENAGQAYKQFLSNEGRVHRPGMMPAVGKSAWQAWASQQTMSLSGEPIKADVSQSGDLGYVYGSYELSGTKPEKGYFARVWKRNASGAWQIVMDTVNPIPPGSQPPPSSASSATELTQKAEAHYSAQQWPEAAAAYQEIVKQTPDDPIAWHRLGTSQIYLKNYSEAIKSLEHAIKVGGSGPLDFYNLACAYALTGEKEKALDNLELAAATGFTNRQQYESDTDLNSLRDTDRFKALLKKLP
jgi:ketosteroid isomerase-like protein